MYHYPMNIRSKKSNVEIMAPLIAIQIRTIVPICCVMNWVLLRHLLFRILEETIFKRPDTIYQNWIMNYLWCICTLCWRFFASSFWLLVLRMNKINLALMYEWFFVMHKKNVAKNSISFWKCWFEKESYFFALANTMSSRMTTFF